MYLRTRDYDGYILKDNLNQIIAADPGIRTIGERLAQATAISMLSQKFDTRREFTDTNPYSPLVAYTAGQRAEMNFTPYDAVGTSYTADASLAINYITINGLVYVNKTAIASPAGAFAPAKWTLLGTLYDLYYLQIPYRIFDYQRHYCVGDSVYWRGKVYTCILESFSVNQEARLHAVEVSNIPNMNYFPDEQKNGALQWGTGTPYVIPANTLDPYTYVNTTFTAYNPATAYVVGNTFLYTEPDGDLIVYYVLQNFTGNTNGTPGTVSAYCNPFTWVLGDNRDQIVLDALIAITLKRIHSRIAPRNIPELRMNEYNEAMRTLKKLADGDIVPDAITTLQPVQGDAVKWGGITKNNNQYN